MRGDRALKREIPEGCCRQGPNQNAQLEREAELEREPEPELQRERKPEPERQLDREPHVAAQSSARTWQRLRAAAE